MARLIPIAILCLLGFGAAFGEEEPPQGGSEPVAGQTNVDEPAVTAQHEAAFRYLLEMFPIPVASDLQMNLERAQESYLFDGVLPREFRNSQWTPEFTPPHVFTAYPVFTAPPTPLPFGPVLIAPVSGESSNLPPGVSYADDSVQFIPGPPTPVALPQPVPLAPSYIAAPMPRPEDSAVNSSRVEHLREAAKHLEAAGHPDAAQVFREEADGIVAASIETLNARREELRRLQQEVAELERATGQVEMVLLRCRYVEIDATKMKALGLSFESFVDGGLRPISGHDEAENSRVFRAGAININSEELDLALSALSSQEDLCKILCEPTLATISGSPASFRSGGLFPIPVQSGPDETTVEWREFGVSLEAVPQILGGGRIRLELASEVAERDFDNAVEIDGVMIPGLNVRRINTQVELQFGESLVLTSHTARQRGIQQTSGDDQPEESEKMFLFIVTPEPISSVSTPPASRPKSPVPPPPPSE